MHSLIPIALAYVIAHYFSLLVYQGQAMAYLISDPLGHGSNLFGTATSTINYNVIGANGVWYVQVVALVLGHVCGLALAHDRALVDLPARPRGDPLAVLDARGHGGLHEPRTVAPLGRRAVTVRSRGVAASIPIGGTVQCVQTDMAAHPHADHDAGPSLNQLALSATVHCLTGCAIGEVLGMVIGTAFGWSNGATIVASIVLAFFFGYALTSLPLLRAGLSLPRVARLAFASDTLSITTMEIVDTLIIVLSPAPWPPAWAIRSSGAALPSRSSSRAPSPSRSIAGCSRAARGTPSCTSTTTRTRRSRGASSRTGYCAAR